MSSMGTPIGTPATTDSRVRCGAAWTVSEKNVSRCASHVETDNAVKARPARNLARSDDPARRPDNTVRTGSRRRQPRRYNSAGGLHHIHARDHMICACSTLLLQARQVAPHPAARGTHSPPLWMRARTRETPAKFGAKQKRECPSRRNAASTRKFGVRIGERKQERNCDGFRAACAHPLSQGRPIPLPSVSENLPFGAARSGTPKRSSRGTRHCGTARTSRRASPWFDGRWRSYLRSLRGDECHACACPLQHRVGTHGCSMPHFRPPRSRLLQPVDHRQRRVRRRREQLQNPQLAVERDAIRERTTGIDRYAQIGPLSLPQSATPGIVDHMQEL